MGIQGAEINGPLLLPPTKFTTADDECDDED